MSELFSEIRIGRKRSLDLGQQLARVRFCVFYGIQRWIFQLLDWVTKNGEVGAKNLCGL